jgi:hypothetical protein
MDKKPGTHKLSEARQGHMPPPPGGAHPDEGGRPKPTHEQLAEDTRRRQESRPDVRPDREDRLTRSGRADQTHG